MSPLAANGMGSEREGTGSPGTVGTDPWHSGRVGVVPWRWDAVGIVPWRWDVVDILLWHTSWHRAGALVPSSACLPRAALSWGHGIVSPPTFSPTRAVCPGGLQVWVPVAAAEGSDASGLWAWLGVGAAKGPEMPPAHRSLPWASLDLL